MNWYLTIKLIVILLVAIGSIGGLAWLFAWLWDWSTDPRDTDAYFDPERFSK